MRLLLDSHVLLWWLTDDETLSEEIKRHIEDEPEVYVSAVTLWEFGIKQARGKIIAPRNLPELIIENRFRMLPVLPDHAVAAARLPEIHRDPFDRMLVAQAGCEDLTLVTRDADILRYEVALLKAWRRRRSTDAPGRGQPDRRARCTRASRSRYAESRSERRAHRCSEAARARWLATRSRSAAATRSAWSWWCSAKVSWLVNSIVVSSHGFGRAGLSWPAGS
jgi:Uncharacterized protein conserved in bacteria